MILPSCRRKRTRINGSAYETNRRQFSNCSTACRNCAQRGILMTKRPQWNSTFPVTKSQSFPLPPTYASAYTPVSSCIHWLSVVMLNTQGVMQMTETTCRDETSIVCFPVTKTLLTSFSRRGWQWSLSEAAVVTSNKTRLIECMKWVASSWGCRTVGTVQMEGEVVGEQIGRNRGIRMTDVRKPVGRNSDECNQPNLSPTSFPSSRDQDLSVCLSASCCLPVLVSVRLFVVCLAVRLASTSSGQWMHDVF